MRVRLTLRSPEDKWVILPTDYNYLIQAAIYRSISRDLANFLHERGFLFGRRRFKMFTFSRLEGSCKFDKSNRRFFCKGDLTLQVSSPIDTFIEELVTTLVRRGYIMVGENQLKVTGVAFPKKPVIKSNEVTIRMLSPVTVYSTLLAPDGKKKTYYYSPFESEFSKLVNSNVKKKYFLLKNKSMKSNINIKPLRVKEVIMTYKGIVIKGWMGSFIVKGAKSLILTAYDTGLGAKNSQGFGMFEVI